MVFSFNAAMSGPKIVLVILTDSGVIGKLQISPECSMLMHSSADGFTTMDSPVRALVAAVIYRLVYPSQFSFVIPTMIISQALASWK